MFVHVIFMIYVLSFMCPRAGRRAGCCGEWRACPGVRGRRVTVAWVRRFPKFQAENEISFVQTL